MKEQQLATSKPDVHPIGAEPIVVKEGSVRVKIYGTWHKSKKTDYDTGKAIEHYLPQYAVKYQLGGKWKSKKFSDQNKAKLHAKSVVTKIRNNETEALKLTGLDRSAYAEAKSILNKLDGSPSLLSAIQEYASAKSLLGENSTSLEQIVKDYIWRNRAIERQVSVAELVEDLISTKEKANLSDDYVRTLRRLRRFGKDFQINAHELTFNILQDYIDSMVDRRGNPSTPRTKRNYWKLINTLIQFGVKRKCMSSEILEQVRNVDLPKDNPSEITIWKPSEFEEMLKATRPELIPTLVLGGFAGIRTAEINRLDWADIDLEKKMVKITASKAKTRSRRIVPLCDAAIAWLKPYSERTGDVAYYAETNKYAAAIMADVWAAREAQGYFTEPEWRKNALRHSFISYRLAETQNAHKVAIEAGNSENIIFKNYRELVTEEEANAWFSIFPTNKQNIIQLRSINP